MSLRGKSILITRRAEQSEELRTEIERRGGRAEILPLISIAPPESWSDCDRAIAALSTFQGIIFTSANAVEMFVSRCGEQGADRAVLVDCTILAIGVKTREAAERFHLRVTMVPGNYTSAALIQSLLPTDICGRRFLLPRGNLAGDDLPAQLQKLGAIVEQVVVYRTGGPDRDHAEVLRLRIRCGAFDVITFASPSAVTNFQQAVPAKEFLALRPRPAIAVIGPTTAGAVRDLGLPVDVMAGESTAVGLADALEHYYSL